MATKRAREEPGAADEAQVRPKKSKGFSVGPANLPDGTYRRKVQKIKKDLIHKARVRKAYAKIKEREAQQEPGHIDDGISVGLTQKEPNLELHPERQALLDAAEHEPEPERESQQPSTSHPRNAVGRPRRQKVATFGKEARIADKRKEEAEARRREREEAARQRQQKIEEREQFRRAMAKARSGGKNGQRKLGRESKVLLEKVQRVMAA